MLRCFTVLILLIFPVVGEEPRYATERDIKVMWVNRLPKPHSLAPDYHQKKREYAAFIEIIRSGAMDLEANLSAAEYNELVAAKAGNAALAETYARQAERAQKAISARDAEQARNNRFVQLRNQLIIIETAVRNVASDAHRFDTPKQ